MKQHLLLVDDDAANLRMMEVGLRKAGFSVTSCKTAHEALDHIERVPPDLVLCEARLPSMDGFELLERVRGDIRTAEVPFLLLTSQRSLGEKVRGLEMGADDYIVKPVYIKELVTRIRVLIERRDKERLEHKEQRGTLSGSLADLGLVDLVQTLETGRKTGVIRCHHGRTDGVVWVSKGRVVDAEVGRLQGEGAFYRLLRWDEGTFEVDFADVHRDERVEVGTQALLMEGMRRLDEWGRMCEALPPLTTMFEVEFPALAQRLGDIPDEVNGVLRLFDGRRTLEQVIDEARFDELQTLAIVSRLYFEGIVREARPEPQAPVAGKPSLEAWINPSGLPGRAKEEEGLSALGGGELNLGEAVAAAPVALPGPETGKKKGKKKAEPEGPSLSIPVQGAPSPLPEAILPRDSDIPKAPSARGVSDAEAAAVAAALSAAPAAPAGGNAAHGSGLALDLASLIGSSGPPAEVPKTGLPIIYHFPPRRGIRKARLRREAEPHPAATPQAAAAALLGKPIPLTHVVGGPEDGGNAAPLTPLPLTLLHGVESGAPAADTAPAEPIPLTQVAPKHEEEAPAKVVKPLHKEPLTHDEEMAEMLAALQPKRGRTLLLAGGAVIGLGVVLFFAFSEGEATPVAETGTETAAAPAAEAAAATGTAPAPATESSAATATATAPAAGTGTEPATGTNAAASPVAPPPASPPASPPVAAAPAPASTSTPGPSGSVSGPPAAAPPPATTPTPPAPPPAAPPPASDETYRRALASGQARYERGDLTGAIREFRKAVDAKPDSVPALQALGNALYENDDLRTSLKTLQRAAELDGKNARTELLLGTVLQTMGKDREAVAHYKAYLKLAPNGEFAADVRAILKDMGK